MPTRLSLESFSLAWDLTMKNGVGLPCTNSLRVKTALLMSLKQGEISQHRDMKCVMTGWIS